MSAPAAVEPAGKMALLAAIAARRPGLAEPTGTDPASYGCISRMMWIRPPARHGEGIVLEGGHDAEFGRKTFSSH